MKLTFVHPQQISVEQFRLLCIGCLPAGIPPIEVASQLLASKWLAFEVDGGMLAVAKRGGTMLVESLAIERFGWRLRALYPLLIRVAADLGCHTVETTCFDERLARAMVRIKAKPAAWVMEWQVAEGLEAARGQQD